MNLEITEKKNQKAAKTCREKRRKVLLSK